MTSRPTAGPSSGPLRRLFLATAALLLLLAGCVGEPPDDEATVTFHGDIEAVVLEHCTPCHREGGAGPFPLETWEQVEPLASAMTSVVRVRFMPPPPDDEVCSEEGARCVALSDAQIALFEQWAAEGFARGNPP